MRPLPSRLADAVVLLWIVTSLTFVLVHLAPGDAGTLLIAPTATAEEIARQRAALGLDAPWVVQYGRWLAGVLRLDFGTSLSTGRPVSALIAEALPVSAWLGTVSLALSFAVGLLLGGWQALRARRAADTALSVAATALYAVPGFWLALALVALFTSGMAVLGAPAWMRLPAFGLRDPGSAATGWTALAELARHAVLPVVVLTVPGAAGIARYARQALGDARGAPHVLVATARGLPRGRVERVHVLRTAWTPLVVLLGLTLPGIVAGSVFVEQVFAWPGVGRAMLSAIATRDYPVVQALTVVYAALVILANLGADLLLLALDPRRRA